MADIISLLEFKRASAMKCSFTGYVYDPKGWVFHVKTRNVTRQTSKPSFPNQNSLWYTNGTIFYENFQSTEISLQEIGSQDVVYDEKGNFVCTRPASNKDRKGQIYIWKQKELKVPHRNPGDVVDEYVPIQDMVLHSGAYSKLFTHLVSMEFKNKLPLIWDSTLSVVILKGERNVIDQCRIPDNKIIRYNANATFVDNIPKYNDIGLKVVIAYLRIDQSDANNQELYATIWNIINLLGAHELMAHGMFDWFSDNYSGHHLAYLYQMGHPSYEHTTKAFQKKMEKSYDKYIEKFNPERADITGKNARILRDHGFYPKKGYESLFKSDMLKSLQDTIKIKSSRPDGLKYNPPWEE